MTYIQKRKWASLGKIEMKIWIKATLVFSLFVIVGAILVFLFPVNSMFQIVIPMTNAYFYGLVIPLFAVVGVFHGVHELSHIVYLRFHDMEDQIDRFSLDSIRTKGDAPLGSYLSPLYSFPVSIVIVWILGFHNLLLLAMVLVSFICVWMIGDFKKYKYKKYIEKRDKHSQDRTAKL